MNQKNDMKSIENVNGCVFPVGPDGQVCGRPVAINDKAVGGRRSLYCDDTDHTRGKAYTARRRYDLPTARNNSQQDATQVGDGVPNHPVTDGRVSLGALLTRFEQSGTQLAAILNRAIEVVRTVSDPDAASYEVEQTQRQAAIQIAEAQGAQAAAEREASNARHQATREAEQRAQADEAAEHALHQVQQIHVELANALSAKAHAEAEKESARQAAEHDRAIIQSLRQQMEQQHQDHRRDLATLRQEAHDERATLTQHYTDQLATLLATLHQTSDPTQTKPATATQKKPQK